LKRSGIAELKNTLKEEAMQNIMTESKAPVNSATPEGTWMQISFTLDTEHYQMLWKRAEEAHLTIPDFVRESVVDALKKIHSEDDPTLVGVD